VRLRCAEALNVIRERVERDPDEAILTLKAA
jgi:hypothetical protein